MNAFIKALINRRDMRNNTAFRKFCSLDDHFPNVERNEARKIASMVNFKQGVRDFIYLPQYKSIFVAMSDMNLLTRVDSYFTNFTMPWEKSKTKGKGVLKEEAVSTVGALQHFIVTEDGFSANDFATTQNQWRY